MKDELHATRNKQKLFSAVLHIPKIQIHTNTFKNKVYMYMKYNMYLQYEQPQLT